MDGWCTDGCTFFVPPCPWANQGDKLKLTSFSFPQPRLVSFFGKFFFSPPTPAQVSPTYRRLVYLLMQLGLLPPPPTYLPTCPPSHPSIYSPTHLPTYPSTYLLMYLNTKSPQRQWWCKSMWVLQYDKYVASFSFLPTSLLDLATLRPSKTMLQWTNWR